jgi:predicted nucleic acid-binding protein
MSGRDETVPSFVDTNILVYAVAGDDNRRSPVAQALLRSLMLAQSLRTSTQVLQELFVTLTRKGRAPMEPEAALRYIDRISAWPVAITDLAAVRSAIALSMTARLSLWDSLIVVAAAGAGAWVLYSEDMQHGQKLMGVEIVNPFRN